MRIDAFNGGLSSPTRSSVPQPDAQPGFQQVMAQSRRADPAGSVLGGATSDTSTKPKVKTPEEKAEAVRAANAALRKELADYLRKSPVVRMREAILARMGLSEDSLKVMTPEQRAAVEADISRQIKAWLLAGQEGKGEANLPPGGLPPSPVSVEALARSPAGMAEFAALQAALAGGVPPV